MITLSVWTWLWYVDFDIINNLAIRYTEYMCLHKLQKIKGFEPVITSLLFHLKNKRTWINELIVVSLTYSYFIYYHILKKKNFSTFVADIFYMSHLWIIDVTKKTLPIWNSTQIWNGMMTIFQLPLKSVHCYIEQIYQVLQMTIMKNSF